MMRLAALLDIGLFALTAYVAYAADWQINELCWGLWITSLLCGWLTITVAIARTLLHVTGVVTLPSEALVDDSPLGGFARRKVSPKTQDLTRLLPQQWQGTILSLGAVLLGLFVTFHFSMFHAIHGALMSVFVRMEPAHLFGPNGYINADFSMILIYLLGAYWPMVVSTVISRHRLILKGNPGANLREIYRGVVKMHIFIILAALLGIVGGLYGKERYDQIVLGLLLFLFFFPWPLAAPKPPEQTA